MRQFAVWRLERELQYHFRYFPIQKSKYSDELPTAVRDRNFLARLFPQEFNNHTHYQVTENGHTWAGYQWPANGPGWDRWWFTTGGNFLSGTVDLNAILQSLVTHGYATGNEWFLGIPLGSEVHCGTGALTINRIHFQLNDQPLSGERQ